MGCISLIFFKLTIITLMLFFGITSIKTALHNRKQSYYPKASWRVELIDGLIFITWAIIMILVEFI